MIRFSCKGCGTPFEVDDGRAGREGVCPKCGRAFRTPSPSVAALPPDFDLEDLDRLAKAETTPEITPYERPPHDQKASSRKEKPVSSRKGKPVSSRKGKPVSSRKGKPVSSRKGKKVSDRKGRKVSDRKGARGSERKEGEAEPKTQLPLILGLGAGALALMVVAAIFALASGKQPPAGYDDGGVSGGGVVADSSGEDPAKVVEVSPGKRLQRLLVALDSAGEQPSAERLAELRAELEALEKTRIVFTSRREFVSARAALQRLEAEQQKDPGVSATTTSEGLGADTPEALAWRRLASALEQLLYRALEAQARGLHAGADWELGGQKLRRELLEVIWEKRGSFQGMLEVLGDRRWSGLLGETGYRYLFGLVPRAIPESMRSGAEWQRWVAAQGWLQEHAGLARRYVSCLNKGYAAYQARDHARAVEAASGASDRDPWGVGLERYLQRPQVVAAFKREVSTGTSEEAASSEPPPQLSGAGVPGLSSAGRALGLGDWQERFEASAAAWKKGGSDRSTATETLGEIIAFSAGLSGESFASCEEVVEFYAEHRKLFAAEAALAEALKGIHQAYFEGRFARCSGPSSFAALDAWCEENGYEEWRERLAPFLRLTRQLVGGKAGLAREKRRAARGKALETVRRFNQQRVEQLTLGLERILRSMAKERFASAEAKAELGELIGRAVERAGSPLAGARLRGELARVQHEPGAKEKVFRTQLDRLVRKIVDASLRATDRALKADEPGPAFDLFEYVLRIDPENARAHKGLGHVKVKGEWMRRYEAAQRKAGLVWDPKRAWVRVKEPTRYAMGQVHAKGRWMPQADADALHGDPNDPWVVRTEHFEVRSSAPLERAAFVAERLEAFYLQMFRHYDLFFANKGAAALVFGVAPMQSAPLVVNFYLDRAQFVAHAQPPAGAAGFYDPNRHASYFYDKGDDVHVLQHEVTHQILEEARQAGSAPAWIAEGSAVYLQEASFRDGVLTVGGAKDNSFVSAWVENVAKGTQHRLSDVLRLESQSAWNAGMSTKNYNGAGAVVHFLCRFDGGRYRADYVEMLRDGYQGNRVRVEDYFNLPVETLQRLMHQFYGVKAPD